MCHAVMVPHRESGALERGLNGLTAVLDVGVVAERRYGRVACFGGRGFQAVSIWRSADRGRSVPGGGSWSPEERDGRAVRSVAEGAAMMAGKKRRSHRPAGSGGDQIDVVVPPTSPVLSSAAARALLRLVRNVAGERGCGGPGTRAASARGVSGEREAA